MQQFHDQIICIILLRTMGMHGSSSRSWWWVAGVARVLRAAAAGEQRQRGHPAGGGRAQPLPALLPAPAVPGPAAPALCRLQGALLPDGPGGQPCCALSLAWIVQDTPLHGVSPAVVGSRARHEGELVVAVHAPVKGMNRMQMVLTSQSLASVCRTPMCRQTLRRMRMTQMHAWYPHL